jgi:hypothetical protein
MHGTLRRSAQAAGLVLLLAAATACSTSIYGWTVRTNSTLPSGSFHPTVLEHEPVAIFEAQAPGGLRGNELGLAYYLADILGTVAPNIKIVSPQDTATRINTRGVAPEYLRMRTDFEHTNILEAAWSSVAEAILSSEAVCQDPVFLEDAARIALGSVVADLLRGKTASTYTPLSEFLDQLIRRPAPEEKPK